MPNGIGSERKNRAIFIKKRFSEPDRDNSFYFQKVVFYYSEQMLSPASANLRK